MSCIKLDLKLNLVQIQSFAMSKVEIIVTIGPNSIDERSLELLKLAGATDFRINLSHSSAQGLNDYFSKMQFAGIMPSIDTQGAQLRVEALPDLCDFVIGNLVRVLFTHDNTIDPESTLPRIVLNHPETSKQMDVGDKLKIDFGGLVVKLIKRDSDCSWLAEVVAGGSVIVNRAVDIQGKSVDLSPLTAFDCEAINYARSKGCNKVYASFVSSSQDVSSVRSVIGEGVKLISKIETATGVANAVDIIEASDAILIDRGDLSREISIPSVPMAVRSILELASSRNCPVHIATNILDSMMTSQLPSRAEISDIYTLLDSGASGLVLAAEVAIGSNPIASTSLLEYLVRLYRNHRTGLHGIGFIQKPSRVLIGEQLFNWL